ncbi:uncharacterized protein LOC114527813 [Dendronephthya gigantea]|uniref:uncharacterized protein LOC114527813 n=1 Tax=Dendronephthya gigantea TaxID=151771 RepID=UPI00106BE024|nr:uncharacterized protein LOC114527813 [Dendronephthya gigantea]
MNLWSFFDYLDDVMRYATRNKFEVIIVGDLNCDCLNSTLRQTERLLEFTMVNELEQLIKQPSRVTPTTSTLIDVLITSTPSLFNEAGVINIALSDHYPIYGVMQCPVTCANKHRIITTRPWNDNKVNDFIADLKQAPWSLVDSFHDVDDMCTVWESLIKSLIDLHFPLKRKRMRKKTHPWLDNTVPTLMRTRDQVHKKAKKSGLPQDWSEYRRLRNNVTKMNRKARKSCFRNKLEENRCKPKVFWDILRLVLPSRKSSAEIGRLVVNGKELSDKRDIANSLNEYFTTIASTLLTDRQSEGNLVDLQQENVRAASSNCFNFRALSEDDVFNALRTTDTSKATGADNISPKILKNAAPYISNVVANIFNAS